MLNPYYEFSLEKIQRFYSRSKGIVILLLVVLCVSCSSAQTSSIDLKLNVQAAGRPGLYGVSGTTTLPDKSQITVAAIRYLRPSSEQSFTPDPKTTYSILDRQLVRVDKGKWQATLNLWQVAPDGRLQEAWQLEQSQAESSLEPAPEVSFVAIFDPAGQLPTSEQQQTSAPELKGSLVRFTNEGAPYLQASQTLRIGLPTGRKPPTGPKPEDINYGWGNRDEIKPEPRVNRVPTQIFKTRQTDAPLSPSEFFR
ncbi:MAG TPA: hypothetical protein V6C95_10860 [Coleofasciculaceae cyanobacterium]